MRLRTEKVGRRQSMNLPGINGCRRPVSHVPTGLPQTDNRECGNPARCLNGLVAITGPRTESRNSGSRILR